MRQVALAHIASSEAFRIVQILTNQNNRETGRPITESVGTGFRSETEENNCLSYSARPLS